MALITYIIASLIMALFTYPGLRRYDGPAYPGGPVHDRYRHTGSYPDQMDNFFLTGMRWMLRGSLFFAGLLIFSWAGVGLLFLVEETQQEILVAIMLSVGSGFGLAIAFYNIRKSMAGR